MPPAMFARTMQGERREHNDGNPDLEVGVDGFPHVINEQLAAALSESEQPEARGTYADGPVTSRTPIPMPPPPPVQARARARGFDPEATMRPGSVLAGKYRIDRTLGRRGRGAALQVFHLELGHYGVLKYLLPEACVMPEAVASFSRGTRAASRIQSEHAARVTDVGRLENGVPYVVTELLRGSTLREISRVRGPLSVAESIDAVLQAGEAVAEAHALGIVHRGLNPTNLVLVQRSDGTALVKVCDFGVAEALNADGGGEEVDSFGVGVGRETLAYLAPEQLRGAGDADARTDIWSLGLILHELLTGTPVYRADTVPALVAMIAADPAPPIGESRPDVSTSLEYAVLCCLEKDRSFRHANIAELAIALRPYASPDGQFVADRIVKILARATRPTSGGHGQALVRVRPPSVAPAAAARPQSAARGMWMATLISIGGIVGATLGATIAVLAIINRVPSFNGTPALPPVAAVSVTPLPSTSAPTVVALPVAPAPPAAAPLVAPTTVPTAAAAVVAPTPAPPAVAVPAAPALAPLAGPAPVAPATRWPAVAAAGPREAVPREGARAPRATRKPSATVAPEARRSSEPAPTPPSAVVSRGTQDLFSDTH